jgi:hypothetical protein
VDNDVILKLAAYNLFGEMAACLAIKREDFRILPTASKYFSRNSRVNQQYKQDSIQRAKRIAEGYQPIERPKLDLEFQLLSQENGIDPGEALLVTATQNEQDFYLLTGDKRFLKALAISNLAAIKQRLYRRFVCLEQLILYVVTYSDFNKACIRVANAESCDQVITDAFRFGKQSKKETVIKVLEGAVEELRSQTGDLLVEHLSCLLPDL